MAPQSLKPNQIFPNGTADSTSLSIPYADLPSLTQAEATPTTGNAAEVMRNILDKAYNQLQAVATADRPTQFTITKTRAVANGVDRFTYTVVIGASAPDNAYSAIVEGS